MPLSAKRLAPHLSLLNRTVRLKAFALTVFSLLSAAPSVSAAPQPSLTPAFASGHCASRPLASYLLPTNLTSAAVRNPYSCSTFSPTLSLLSQSPGHQAKPLPANSGDDHHFWNRQNDLLFTAVGASRTLDYFSTLNFRRRGRDEVFLNNAIVDDHAAFAAIEAGGTALSIGVSYLFHHYHHHRLERWTSIVHAGAATSGAVRNYCLETAHP